MLLHAYIPVDILTSTILPIPKDRKKSLHDSSNYRGIALNSLLGKILDHILLTNYKNVFQTSDRQFGFKAKHSTVQCTFVVKETLQYYITRGSSPLLLLLDASKAFDRVTYVKLFNLLIKKVICPLVARLLAVMYNKQQAQIKWDQSSSKMFRVTNGVKQGGVLSPVLFSIYLDELLYRITDSGYGCFIGTSFVGCFAYADDIVLLAPTKYALSKMYKVACKFASEYSMLFIAKKSQLMLFDTYEASSMTINGEEFMCTNQEVHLGNVIGTCKNATKNVINDATNDFIKRVNVINAQFRSVFCSTKYKLINIKTFCMPMYGYELWDFSYKYTEFFYVARRKSIILLWSLPYRTHRNILPIICDDLPVEYHLHIRFLKSIKFNMNTDN